MTCPTRRIIESRACARAKLIARRSRRSRIFVGVLFASCALSGAVPAAEFPAPAQWGVFYGYGDHTDLLGAQLVWDSPWLRESLAPYALVPRLDASIAAWRARDRSTQYSELASIGGDAVLRYAPVHTADVRPFVDASLGIHFLTNTHINNRDLGASFQFASTLAVGVAFGEAEPWELSAFVQHISNAETANFNDGFTYAGIRLRALWR